MLEELINKSISFTQEEKTILLKNINSFSDDDKKKLLKILKKEQIKILELKEKYFKKEKNIIIKYVKELIKLGNFKRIQNTCNQIKKLKETEKNEMYNADIFLEDKLNNL